MRRVLALESHHVSHARQVAMNEAARATWANRLGCKLGAEGLAPDFTIEAARKALRNTVRAETCVAVLDAITDDVRAFMRRHA